MTTEQQWERQRRTFERTAEAYDRYRPTYPDAIFDDIRAFADLAPDDAILEIGCGTGRATKHFAAWGNPVVAIEPAAAMADVARRNLEAHPNVDVRTTRFEDTQLDEATFGLVACAQAWHWLDPASRIDRTGDLLYGYGTAAIFWNAPVLPEDGSTFQIRVQDVYRAEAAELAHRGDFRKPGEPNIHALESSALFVDLEQRVHRWDWTLSTSEYIGLLHTHSPHAALDPDARERLTDGIVDLIDSEFGGYVTEYYECVVDLARRGT